MSSHPVISAEKMHFNILHRFACKFRLEMTPINHLLVNYLRGRLMWKRLWPLWSWLEGTSRLSWGRLLWKGLLWNRLIWQLLRNGLIWRGLLWCRLVWHLLRGALGGPKGALLSLLSLLSLFWLALAFALLPGFSWFGMTGPAIFL